MSISEVYIYSEPRCPSVDFEEILSYAKDLLPAASVSITGPLVEEHLDGDGGVAVELSALLAKAKVKSIDRPVPQDQAVLPGESAYELRRLGQKSSAVFGLIYDAYILSGVYSSIIPSGKSRLDQLHIVFTNQLIGTWSEADRRYHARTVLCGSPSIISLSGITIAPARDRGFYIARRGAEALGLSEEEKMAIADKYSGDSLNLDDVRLTGAAKGYVAQAIAYRLTGEAFCSDPDCRLYNAHWQHELIRAQLECRTEFCEDHAELFRHQARKIGGLWTSDCM